MTEIPDLLEVDPAHREDLEALMDLLRVAVQLESRCEYGDSPGDGERRGSFLAHFGELREPLEQWNAGIARVEAAPGALWGWLARTTIDRGVSEPPFAIGALIDRLAILTASRARQGLLETPHRLFLEHFKDRLGGGEGVSIYVEGQNVARLPNDPQKTLEARITGAEEMIQGLFDDAQKCAEAEEIVAAQDALIDLKQPLLDRLALHAAIDVILFAPDCPICARKRQEQAAAGGA
jgi:hypothetical protein